MLTKVKFHYKNMAFMIAICFTCQAAEEEYYFDPTLLQGSAYSKSIASINGGEILAGEYIVDVFVNDTLIKSSLKIIFKSINNGKQVEPCLPLSLMQEAQVKSLSDKAVDHGKSYRSLRQWVSQGEWHFDRATLQLRLSIPMNELIHRPRGYISPSQWDSGVLALFLRHNTNWTYTENTDQHLHSQYLWSGINVGSNFGLWQVRHQGNLRHTDSHNQGSDWYYTSVRTWLQRPISAINSIMTLGDNYTDPSLFGSLLFSGIKFATDERMWPQGKRGYAPEVHGVAASSAQVVIKQLGKVIYETHVPPGPFYIDDLYNTKNQGDLQVEVIEANGKISHFIVPYSSVPDSVRPGNWHYSFSLGKVRQYKHVDNRFFEGTAQFGINNNLTINLGSRLAKDYYAWLGGAVWATRLGAIGMNATLSHARIQHNDRKQGWRAELSYSKTFSSGTNLVLAAYRYSTDGFRDLQDVLGVRRQLKTGIDYYSDILHQKNRLSATISQPLGQFGTVNLSASTADYYHNQSRITQLQIGYSNQWRKLSYGLNLARQRTTQDYGDHFYHHIDELQDQSQKQKYTETILSLTLSIPFDWKDNRTSAAINYSQSRNSQSSTLSITGSSGEQSDFSWSLYGGYDHHRYGKEHLSTNFGAGFQQNTRLGTLRAGFDQGKNYRQLSLGTSGTLVLHSGGITLGPYTSDTFALIHADGAQGAVVQNGQGAVIDHFGYAILPTLSPYRRNNISLDTRHMNRDTELSGGSQQVVPYSGAIAKVNFATITGKAVLIAVKKKDGSIPPMGAEVLSDEGAVIGMVGQGGQVYARINHNSGRLLIRWGKSVNQYCRVPYQIDLHSSKKVIYLTTICEDK